MSLVFFFLELIWLYLHETKMQVYGNFDPKSLKVTGSKALTKNNNYVKDKHK